MAGVKGRSGGARPNSGRPPKERPNYDEEFKEEVKKVVNKLKKKHGTSFLEQAFSLMYKDKTQASVKVSLMKIYIDIFVTKKTESNLSVDRPCGPRIGLPPRDEDPALAIARGKAETNKQ